MTMPIQSAYDRLVARKALLLDRTKKDECILKQLQRKIKGYEKARIVFTEVSKSTQDETKRRIESLITLAIRSVFEDKDYTFKIQFETKNNRVYAYPIIMEDDVELDPKEDVAGGVIDIISIAMKIILWHMEDPPHRNTLIIDEPFRFTGKLVSKAGYMIKYLSENLKIQIIMVSHDDELIKICDKVYKVTKQGKESKLTLIKEPIRRIKRRKK